MAFQCRTRDHELDVAQINPSRGQPLQNRRAAGKTQIPVAFPRPAEVSRNRQSPPQASSPHRWPCVMSSLRALRRTKTKSRRPERLCSRKFQNGRNDLKARVCLGMERRRWSTGACAEAFCPGGGREKLVGGGRRPWSVLRKNVGGDGRQRSERTFAQVFGMRWGATARRLMNDPPS